MFKCLYCNKLFPSKRGRSLHEKRNCPRRPSLNVVDDVHYGPPVAHFDNHNFIGDGDDQPQIVNVDFSYVQKQESYYRICYNIRCLYESTDMKSFMKLMPVYSREEIMLNKIAEFKRSANLSRANGNLLLELLHSFHHRLKLSKLV